MAALPGKKSMVWAFMQNARMFEAFDKYGDRFDTVGLFTFEVNASGTLTESGTSISRMIPYIRKWPHIKWLLTIMNNGYASIFTALRNNTNGAQDKFMREIIRIMEKYPWCAGIDIDLERGGGYENKDAANALFRRAYETVKNYNSAKIVNVCLPGMTGVQGSVGGENWCVYADLAPFCDTMAIMSYGEAWAGSAPGPTSSRDWLVGIYNYATAVVPPEKIFMGLPGYGWEWQIYDTPENLGKTYRAISLTYYDALGNMRGEYHYADSQQFIPFISYWDDYDKVPWGLLYVYDFLEGWDADSYEYPMTKDTYNRRKYLTSYTSIQKAEFGAIFADIKAVNYSEASNIDNTGVFIGFNLPDSYAVYNIYPGSHKLVIQLCFTFFSDDNEVKIEFIKNGETIGESFLRPPSDEFPSYVWPYYRSVCWLEVSHTFTGADSIKLSGNSYAHIYAIRVCSNFSESRYSGDAEFTLSPRKYRDVDGDSAEPANGFKLTCEVLRRNPDSALIWYEDFCDDVLNQYYIIQSGSWRQWHDAKSEKTRPYSQLEGSGEIAFKYNGFQNIHVRGRFAFPSNGTGKAGIFFGSLFCCLNISSQRIELYQNDNLIGYYNTTIEKNADRNIRNNPVLYTIEMRIRGNKARVYSGAGSELRFTVNITPTSGYAGIRSDSAIKCDLFRIGDAYCYEPYEAFDVVYPNGEISSFGRIERNNVTWSEKYGVFKVNSDIEEEETRSEEISMYYDFFHSPVMPNIQCENDYAFKFIPKDINIWCARLFLGDSDGFAIQYYQDAESILYWADQAAYHWKVRGFALWSLGTVRK